MGFGKSPSEWVLQQKLLGELPRSSLLRAVAPGEGARTLRLRCQRSMLFELVSEFVGAFTVLWDARVQVSISDYDPSLAAALRGGDEDILLLWIDWRLHHALAPAQAARWISELVTSRRKGFSRGVPVLVNDWPLGEAPGVARDWASALNEVLRAAANAIPDCHVVELERLRREDCPDFFSARNDAVAHYPFSQAATVNIARHLGSQLLPALATPRLKVVAIDLDQTLYAGVLGEDGPLGVRLEPGHFVLQRRLLQLKEAGFLLALCSRNEWSDVKALFAQRADFALSLADFAAARVDWRSKADNLRSIAAQLNLHSSSILFVDDNPAELGHVAQAAPEIEVLLATPSGEKTAAMLGRHPGLFRLRADAASAVRTRDLQANQIRERLRESSESPEGYLARLGMVIELFENRREHASRIHELSNKTNQFNLCLARLTESGVESFLRAGCLTFSVGLKDALADSGIVAALLFELAGTSACLVEFLVSCRALGREVETVAFSRALDRLAELGCDSLEFRVRKGPRNKPAMAFLRRFVPDSRRRVPLGPLRNEARRAIHRHPAEVRVHR
jgi:FkbH-like protein